MTRASARDVRELAVLHTACKVLALRDEPRAELTAWTPRGLDAHTSAKRGLLDTTLVVAMGEFGRTPTINGNAGRDHWPDCYSLLLAGGGIKGGVEVGETDEYSYNVSSDPVHINEINATVLHCLGINHELFTVRYQGLDQRQTGVEPMKVIRKILA